MCLCGISLASECYVLSYGPHNNFEQFRVSGAQNSPNSANRKAMSEMGRSNGPTPSPTPSSTLRRTHYKPQVLAFVKNSMHHHYYYFTCFYIYVIFPKSIKMVHSIGFGLLYS